MGAVLAVVPGWDQDRTDEELARQFPGHDIHVFESADQLGLTFGTRIPDLVIFPLTLPAPEQQAVAALLEQWDPGGGHRPGDTLSASAATGVGSDREWFYWLKPVNKTPPSPRPDTPPADAPLADTRLRPNVPDAPLAGSRLRPSVSDAPLPGTTRRPSVFDAPLAGTRLRPSVFDAPLADTRQRPSVFDEPLAGTTPQAMSDTLTPDTPLHAVADALSPDRVPPRMLSDAGRLDTKPPRAARNASSEALMRTITASVVRPGIDRGRTVVVHLLRVMARAAGWSGRSGRSASVFAWRTGKRSARLAFSWVSALTAFLWASRADVLRLITVTALITGLGMLGIVAIRFLPPLGRTRAAAPPVTQTAAVTGPEDGVARPIALHGQLDITSEPSGALVSVDGERRGATPLLLDNLAPGQHVVTLTQGVNTVKHVVKVKANQTATLDAPIYSGWVALFAPFELQVWDGSQPVILDERNRVMLSPGPHELRLANAALGYRGTQVVNIRPMEVTPVSLVAPQSAISVTSSAPSEVWIDGVHVGQTPLVDQPVNIGTREIVCRSETLGERRVTATVTTKPLRISIDFAQPGA